MSVTKTQLVSRGILLFLVGVSLALVLNMLQIQRHFPSIKYNLQSFLLSASMWSVPAICGIAAAAIGLVYPYLGAKDQVFCNEWSNVMRCVAMFIGLNQATAKINFSSNLQLSFSLTVLSLIMWWLFDGTRNGFGMGLFTALLATFITHLLVYNGFWSFSEREFLYVRSWLPCIMFSGGITVGNIGRQLALGDETSGKRHQE